MKIQKVEEFVSFPLAPAIMFIIMLAGIYQFCVLVFSQKTFAELSGLEKLLAVFGGFFTAIFLLGIVLDVVLVVYFAFQFMPRLFRKH
jgi:hypothetical protein